jgi:hypothetical protein
MVRRTITIVFDENLTKSFGWVSVSRATSHSRYGMRLTDRRRDGTDIYPSSGPVP